MTVLICSEYAVTRLRDLERTALRAAFQRRGVYLDAVTELFLAGYNTREAAEFVGLGAEGGQIAADVGEDVVDYIDAMPIELSLAATVGTLREGGVDAYVHYRVPGRIAVPALERTGLTEDIQAAVSWDDVAPAELVSLVAENPDEVLVLGHSLDYLAPYVDAGCHVVCCSHEDITPRSVLDLLHTLDTLDQDQE